MGFILPSPNNPKEHARLLMERKDAIQVELDAQFSILSANQSTMQSPLVDREGFPRADIDVFAVRHARVRIIELRNDMNAVMNDIAKALETVHANPASGDGSKSDASISDELHPFAKVDGVAPASPAATAVHILTFLSLSIKTKLKTFRIFSLRVYFEKTYCCSLAT